MSTWEFEKVYARDIMVGDYICGYDGSWSKPGLVMEITIQPGLTIDRFFFVHDGFFPNPELYGLDMFTRLTDAGKLKFEAQLFP